MILHDDAENHEPPEIDFDILNEEIQIETVEDEGERDEGIEERSPNQRNWWSGCTAISY